MRHIVYMFFCFLPVFASLTGRAQTQQELPPFDPSSFSISLKGLSQKQLVRVLDSVSVLYAERNPQEGIVFIDFALRQLELKNIDQKEFARFYLRRGQKYTSVVRYSLALNDLLKAEQIYMKYGSRVGLQQVYIAYANLYMRTNRNVKAIRYALKAREYSVSLNDAESLGIVYNTLATLYMAQDLPDSAMFYYRSSLREMRARKDHRQEALLMDNMSMLWGSLHRQDSAAVYNAKALAIAKRTKNAYLELQLLLNTASIIEKTGDYEAQYRSSLRAKFLADSLGNFPYQVYTRLNIGSALLNLKKYSAGVKILQASIPHLTSFGDIGSVQVAYSELSRAYEGLEQYDSSLFYYKKAKEQEDSLRKVKASDEVVEVLAAKQMEVQEQRIAHLNDINRASEEKNALKTAIIWISVCLLVVIAVLLVITFKRFRDNKKLSRLLEVKNTEITDSINYARRIQFALLPHENEIARLLPDSFILFRPKDIVSGDFYWITHKGHLVFVVVGDCTGHGVPGGFMSMLGHSFLNDIIVDKHEHDPGRILDRLREKVIGALKQTGATGENKDGMDISIAVIDKTNGLITYAAANNPLYLVRNGALTELKADKQPIGFYGQAMQPFTTHAVRSQSGDRLYMTTDGYADQFGGEKGKKMLYKRMKAQLLEGSRLTGLEQRAALEAYFTAWKGVHEQVDDVCLVRISL